MLAKIDSQVMARQVEKEYMAWEPELVKYLATVRALERRFQGFTLKYIPRAENSEPDELAKVAANNSPMP
jgi:ribonuclease HI